MDENDNPKNEENKEQKCFFCNRNFAEVKQFPNCMHIICNFCLFERIFTLYIADLQDQQELNLSCICEKRSTLNLDMKQLLDIVTKKRQLDLKKVSSSGFETIEQTVEGCECSKDINENKKQLFSDYFCVDCYKWVCAKCKFEEKNDHFNHRVLKSRSLIQNMRDKINQFFCKSKDLQGFKKFMEEKESLFQEIIAKNFAKSIEKINELIESATQLKNDYIEAYKKQMADIIKVFKIIKIYYLNYFTDKSSELDKKNVENNDIFKLKYLNNISNEFADFNLEHYNISSDIDKIKDEMDNLLNEKQLIKAKFNFEKIEKRYILEKPLQAHNKFITGLIKLKNKIITSALDYTLKIWDNEGNKYKELQTIKKEIAALLGLKNGKFAAAIYKTTDIYIYKQNNTTGLFQNSQSLNGHNGQVTALLELEDGSIISGSLDSRIIIWKEDEKLNQYMPIQKIEDKGKITLFANLNNFQFAYSTAEAKSKIGIIGGNTEINENGKLITTKFSDICELEINKGRINCICLLNNGYIASGGCEEKNNTENNIYIWTFFEEKCQIFQCILRAHESDINYILQLRDGTFASSSKDRTLRIWKNIGNMNNKIEYILIHNLDNYKHGMYKLIQLDDDRIVCAGSDNYLALWNSNASFM